MNHRTLAKVCFLDLSTELDFYIKCNKNKDKSVDFLLPLISGHTRKTQPLTSTLFLPLLVLLVCHVR